MSALRLIAGVLFAHDEDPAAKGLEHEAEVEEDYEHHLVLVAVVTLSMLLFSLLAGYFVTHKMRITWLPEAGVVLLCGMFFGYLLSETDNHMEELHTFKTELFFVVLLPPIIFHAGYSMKRRFFFANLGPIMCLAFVGTSVSTLAVAFAVFYGGNTLGWFPAFTLWECMTFGALISATDPVSTLAVFAELKVDPTLFYLVFGESVLNDAVAIVLFRSFKVLVELEEKTAGEAIGEFFVIFIFSTILGTVAGGLCSLLFKHIHIKHNPTLELAVFAMFSYLPFLAAEAFKLSGIVAILFTGIVTKHYTHRNLGSQSARDGADFMFHTMAFVTESLVFLDLGLGVFAMKSGYSFGLIGITVVVCLISRAVHVYPLMTMCNQFRKNKLKSNQMHALWFSGLRGAIAYALAADFPKNPHHPEYAEYFKATTTVIVLMTVFFMGGGTITMLKTLKIQYGVEEDNTEYSAGEKGVKKDLLSFDKRVLMPFLTNDKNYGRRGPPLTEDDSAQDVEMQTVQHGAGAGASADVEDAIVMHANAKSSLEGAGAGGSSRKRSSIGAWASKKKKSMYPRFLSQRAPSGAMDEMKDSTVV